MHAPARALRSLLWSLNLLVGLGLGGVASAQPAEGQPGEVLAAPATPARDAAPAPAPSADYRQTIGALEARVDSLKDQVLRTRARLTVLDAAVRQSAIAGASLEIVHRNQMGSSFTLEKVVYRLDGTPIFERVDTDGGLDAETALTIYEAAVVPGDHTLDAQLIYRGNGFRIFSYLRSYVFTVRSSHTFNVDEGKRIRVEAIGYERGGATRSLEDRPDIRFEDTIDDLGEPEPGG